MLRREIFCDKCGVVGASSTGRKGKRALALRTSLHEKGWIHRKSGSKDICPACQVTEKQEKRQLTLGIEHEHA